MIIEWEKKEKRPRIILHSCCAPCSTYTLEFLTKYADVTIFFANSNIHPESEYRRRALVQKEFINDFNLRTGQNVKFIEGEYKPKEFIKEMVEKNLDNEPEGGERCKECFNMRLDLVAKLALEEGYDYFGSALTISPKKDANLINELGIEIQKLYNVLYLPSDFKKNKGYERSIEMCREYEIYRQCYCGCIFAASQQGIDLKDVNKEAKEFINKK